MERPAPRPRPPGLGERRTVLRWLDAGLRRGEGRLAAEYPLVFGEGGDPHQQVIFEDGRPTSHALWCEVEVRARGRSLRVGLIGSVYTDPEQRGRGLAGACVRACLRAARVRGIPLMLLWSELVDYYARLGFHATGRDALLGLEGARLAPLAPDPTQIRVTRARPEDFEALEACYARKPVHVSRRPGALARLADAPATTVVVARRDRLPVAYAALGRGDDFHGVVHEWAGAPEGVLACLAWLVRRHGPLQLLVSPEPEPPVPTLLAAGSPLAPRPLGLARLLDAAGLWRALAPAASPFRLVPQGEKLALAGPHGSVGVTPERALELFFGAGPEVLGPAIDRAPFEDLLPWPLYVWGFDSV